MTELEEAYRRALAYGESMVIPASLSGKLRASPHCTTDGDQLLYKGIRVIVYISDDDLLNAPPPGEIKVWLP